MRAAAPGARGRADRARAGSTSVPWRVPAGTRLWAPMALVQRAGDEFDDPDRFVPERFLGAQAEADDLDPVRRRQPALPGHGIRDARDASGAADDPLAGIFGPAPASRRARASTTRSWCPARACGPLRRVASLADRPWAERVARQRDDCPPERVGRFDCRSSRSSAISRASTASASNWVPELTEFLAGRRVADRRPVDAVADIAS